MRKCYETSKDENEVKKEDEKEKCEKNKMCKIK